MTEFLETTIDKFIFRVAIDRFYNDQGVWVKEEDGNVRVGLSDFVQQRNGDVAFAEIKPVDTNLVFGDDLAEIETIKVNITFTSPVTGKVIEINPAMQDAPEAINQDPYGEGWLAIIKPFDWTTDLTRLRDPQTYFARMRTEAEEEAKKP